MKLRYELWVNEQRDKEGRNISMLDGHKKYDPLVFAYGGEIDVADRTEGSLLQASEHLFAKFNIEHPSDYRNRSMSVGDVVIFNLLEVLTPTLAVSDEPGPTEAAFAVKNVGFEKIEVPDTKRMLIPTEHRTVREVLRDLNVRLKKEGIEAGESNWSDMTRYCDAGRGNYEYSKPWPQRARWIVVYPVTGSNEGYYLHLDAVYQVSTLFGEDLAKAKAKDPNTFSLKEGREDRRIVLGQAKTWDWDNAWQIAKRTAELLEV